MASTANTTDWDPLVADVMEKPTSLCLSRIKKDLEAIFKEPLPLIFVVPDEEDITKIHSVMSGPVNTPYEGGFFYFMLKIPPNYPIQPPKVKFMTTAQGSVRFNPNLYSNGKVCLSILGTWIGPPWTCAQTIQSLLLSIQSLLNEHPYSNEPGFSHTQNPEKSKLYNDYIQHETLRVAVCDMVEGYVPMPTLLQEMVQRAFLQYTDFYEEVIASNMNSDYKPMFCPYGMSVGHFRYSEMAVRLHQLTEKMRAKYKYEPTY